MDGNQFKHLISSFFNKHLLKIEISGAVLFFTGMIMMEQQIQGGSILIGLCLTVLATVYYLLAFMPTQETAVISIISQKVMGISSAIIMVGIMFQLFRLNGGKTMLLVGLTSIFLAVILNLIGTNRNEEGLKHKGNILRALIIWVLGTFIYYYPSLS